MTRSMFSSPNPSCRSSATPAEFRSVSRSGENVRGETEEETGSRLARGGVRGACGRKSERTSAARPAPNANPTSNFVARDLICDCLPGETLPCDLFDGKGWSFRCQRTARFESTRMKPLITAEASNIDLELRAAYWAQFSAAQTE